MRYYCFAESKPVRSGSEDMDVSAYLARIEYDGSLELTPEVLSAVHYAHLLSVPFENLDIHLGKEILLDESQLFNKIINQRRGGFCYELNGSFAALLKRLGFEVDLLSARVYGNGGYGPEYDHLALRVRLKDDWLVDVGFGDSFNKPMRLGADDVFLCFECTLSCLASVLEIRHLGTFIVG